MQNSFVIDNKQYDNVLFVHIPKTGGSSILSALRNKRLDTWNRKYLRGHDPIFSLKENNILNNTFSFGVARNPYTRTYSAFKQFNKANKLNISFLEYLKNILDNKINKNTPLLHLSQSFFLLNKDGSIGVDKVYSFENMHEVENDLNIKLEKLNIGKYTKEEYFFDYSQEAIDIVNNLYKVDFDNFGYSINIEVKL
jgi:hypothetical protein